ncbi:MAG: hypothetical protein ACI8UO_001798 [Verrucomicrobiales bacterium]|jgi:hypothetical protein
MNRLLSSLFSAFPAARRRWYMPTTTLANEYQVTRFLIVRLLGLCYAMAFLIFLRQGPGLIGEHGILPADRLLSALAEKGTNFWQLPTIFWFNHSDAFMQGVAWTGLVISIAVFLGYANGIMLFVLWALQMSILHVGQQFWSYGWETQLLETGFLGIFLVPLFDGRPFSKTPASRIVLWLYRWLIIRIMLGAGLIKLRGDSAWDWNELSALLYHFETQPIPNGFSWYFHQAPEWLLKGGVLANHLVELIVPALLLLPRGFRNWAGVIMILFQVNLIVSGNLSFLNYLTIIPCLACIDDRFYRKLLPSSCWLRIRERSRSGQRSWREKTALGFRAALALMVIGLSIPVVVNLLSPNQKMNAGFDRFHLVNTYGAFGSVGKVRYEIAIEGTSHPAPKSGWARWQEYDFYGKPGDPGRRPPFFSPYHHRLDWEIWFAASGSLKGEPWHVFLATRLLENRPEVTDLFRQNPFADQPPTAIRMTFYEYRFTTPKEREANGDWWVRESKGQFLQPVTLDDLQKSPILKQRRWPTL